MRSVLENNPSWNEKYIQSTNYLMTLFGRVDVWIVCWARSSLFVGRFTFRFFPSHFARLLLLLLLFVLECIFFVAACRRRRCEHCAMNREHQQHLMIIFSFSTLLFFRHFSFEPSNCQTKRRVECVLRYIFSANFQAFSLLFFHARMVLQSCNVAVRMTLASKWGKLGTLKSSANPAHYTNQTTNSLVSVYTNEISFSSETIVPIKKNENFINNSKSIVSILIEFSTLESNRSICVIERLWSSSLHMIP